MLDRTAPPILFPLADFRLPRPTQTTLSNGAELFTYVDGKQPLFNLQLIYGSGRSQETQKGQSLFVSRLLTEGTSKYSSKEIHDRLGSLGANLSVQPGYDFIIVDVFGMSRFFSEIISLVFHLIEEASFPPSECELLKKNTLQQIKINQQKSNVRAEQLFKELLYGKSHPYGYSLVNEDIISINPALLHQFHQQHLLKAPQFAYLVGDVSPKEQEQIRHWLDGKASGSYLKKASPNSNLFEGGHYEEKDDALQSTIRMGGLLPKISDAGRPHLDLLNHLLGGYFGSLLMQNLREEKGLTYGVFSQVAHFQEATHLLIGADVQKKDRKLAIQEIEREINVVLEGSFTENEIALAKNHLSGSYIKSIHSPFSLVEYFKNISIKKLPPNFYDTYVSSIQNTTPSEIVAMAAKTLTLQRATVSVG